MIGWTDLGRELEKNIKEQSVNSTGAKDLWDQEASLNNILLEFPNL
jgi:hypothetical protein